MEKISVVFSKKKQTKIDFEDQEIIVLNFIPFADKAAIAEWYIEEILEEGDISTNIIKANTTVMLGVIDACTNVEIEDLDGIVSSGLWSEIKKNILDYDEFIEYLSSITNIAINKKKEKMSLESKASHLIDVVEAFLKNISSLDMSEEGISQLLKTLGSVGDEFQKKYGLTEPIPIEKPKRKRKPKVNNEQEENKEES